MDMSHTPLNIIGITGGIGSGKSVVSRILRLNGFNVYDCDSEARMLMETDFELKRRLIEILGPQAYSSAGVLDRRYIAGKIFFDSALRNEVNAVVHRAVKENLLSYAERIGGVVFCESAILATSRFDAECKKIWVVMAPEDERIARVGHRDSLSREEIEGRIASQQKEFDMLPSAKVIEIRNGDDDLLLPQIYELINLKTKEEICLEKF